MADLLSVVLGYLLGSIPVGLWLGKFSRGLDVREHGSGSTGSTNVLRTLGLSIALLTFLMDVGKGVLAITLAHALGDSGVGLAGAGLAAVIGHDWPVLAGFRGGKGVATTMGALLLLAPIAVMWAVLASLVAFAWTRIASVASLTGSLMAVLVAVLLTLHGDVGTYVLVFALGSTALIWYRHSPNLRRLVRNQEPRVAWP